MGARTALRPQAARHRSLSPSLGHGLGGESPLFLVVIVLCVLLAAGVYVALSQYGVLPKLGQGDREDNTGTTDTSDTSPVRRFGYDRSSEGFGPFPSLESLSPGCLYSMMAVMGLWILAWLVLMVVGLVLLWNVA